MSKDNCVYIMSTTINGTKYYKVGVSNDPNKRLKAVNTGSVAPVLLESVDDHDDAYKCEKFIHRELQKYHVRGEWFSGEDLSVSVIRRKMWLYTWE